jgi:site-specific recombinase XerD
MIAQWFDSFLQEKMYIKNLSAHTIRSYKSAFKTFCKFGGDLSKDGITYFIVECRKAGMKPITVNTYSRGLNSFFTWLHENSPAPELLRVKLTKKENLKSRAKCDFERGE